MPQRETPEMTPMAKHMLDAILRLHTKKPGVQCAYPMISDEVRRHTEGKTVPNLGEMKKAKPSLMEHGLIAKEGNGFVPTDKGKEHGSRESRAA